MKYWGEHLILDCAGGNDGVKDYYTIREFIKELVPAIDMIAYGEPQIAHFAEHDPTKAGYTLVQLIETSSITAHFVDSNGDFYLDIFSCKAVPVEVAIATVEKYFAPKTIKKTFLTRQA